jgi:hypothetical protein
MVFPTFKSIRSSAGFILLLSGLFMLVPLSVKPADSPVLQNQIPVAADTSRILNNPADSLYSKHLMDSISADSIRKKPKSEAITQVVEYSAEDSLVFLDGGIGKLYNLGSVKYGDLKLNANYIQMDMDSSLLSAVGTPDSTGRMVGNPIFSDKGGEYKIKAVRYNFKTRKGLFKQIVTQQGEGYVVSGTTKKVENELLCMVDGKYTTCENKEHPHFYLALSKAKIKQKGWIVSGPAHLVMEDVDLPLFIPFGFFPFKSDYSSGFLMPTYGDELQRGFYLSDMGYYFAFNDYVDLALRADIYSKGSWGVKANSTYRKLYKFTGSFNANYIETVTSEKNLPDYSKVKDIRLDWRHSQDAKANPYQSFSAGVNFATSGYSRNDLGTLYNNKAFSENQKSSSVSFAQRFPESPVSLSLNLNINQVTKDTTVSVSFPNLSVSVSSLYPFKRKNGAGEDRWYERIRMSYSGRMANSISGVKEYDFFKKSLLKDWKNGVSHSIPISADFTILNYINLNASMSYTERWYSNALDKYYDPVLEKVLTDTTWGFNRVWDYSVSMGLSTRLYGMYQLNPKVFGKFSQIRHVLTPSVSFNYRPDFGESKYGYWGVVDYVDKSGVSQHLEYNRYANGLYGVPSKGRYGAISFSLNNNVEMKMKQVTDTAINEKKISIIDGFNIGGSYNLAADSLKLGDISVSLRLRFGNIYTLNLATSLQPYTYILNQSGNPVRVNTTQFKKYGIPGRMSGVGTSFQYTLGNETFKKLIKLFGGTKKESKDENTDGDVVEPQPIAANGTNGTKPVVPTVPRDPEEALYMPSKVPWSINFSYNIRYSLANFNKNKLEYDYKLTQNLSLGGNLSLTKKWNFSANSSYNFVTKKLDQLTCSFTRDLHCWSMTGSFIPVGNYKSYNITIAVKSSLLSDLKYEQHQNPRDNHSW